jgi:predicted Zn-dependent protease
LAYVYLRQKKPQDAYTILRGVTERNPNQPEILMHLAEAQILMGNKLEGKKTLDRILALEPPATIKSKANQLSKSL